jgi:hypothetical protein
MVKNSIYLVLLFLIIFGFCYNLESLFVNAAGNQWSTLSSMPTKRGNLGTIEFNGRIFVIGGQNENGFISNNEVYDISSDSWSIKAQMPTARSSFSIFLYQNKIYCMGGITGDVNSPEITGITEVYDPNTDTWESKSSMPTPRADLSANIVGDAVYLIGGKQQIGIDPFFQEVNINELYFPENDTWINRSPMFIPVFGYSSVVVEENIYIFGGARQFDEGGSSTPIRSNQMYDPRIDAWRNLAIMPNPKSHAASGVTKGETAPVLVYSIGGIDQAGISDTNYAYNIETNNWTEASPIPTPRANLDVVEVNDVFFAIGGFDGSNWLNDNEMFAPIEYGSILPRVLLLSPQNITYSSNNVSLVLSVNRATNWIGSSLDNKENITISGDTTLTGLSEGTHKLIVYINDTFGNIVSSDTIFFSVDTKPPIITIISPTNRTYNEMDVQSIVMINEPISWLGYSLDGQETITITGNVTLAVLSEGSHYIKFNATDIVGNNGVSETIYFNIAPFPTLLVIALFLIIIIVIMTIYLFINRNQQEK